MTVELTNFKYCNCLPILHLSFIHKTHLYMRPCQPDGVVADGIVE